MGSKPQFAVSGNSRWRNNVVDLLASLCTPPPPNVKFGGTADSRSKNWPTSGIGDHRHSPAKSDRQHSVLNRRSGCGLHGTTRSLTRNLGNRPALFLMRPLSKKWSPPHHRRPRWLPGSLFKFLRGSSAVTRSVLLHGNGNPEECRLNFGVRRVATLVLALEERLEFALQCGCTP